MAAEMPCNEALLEALRRERLDTTEGAFAYAGGEDMNKPDLGHRRRTRISLADGTGRTHELYLKRYGPEKLSEKLKSIEKTKKPKATETGDEGVKVKKVRRSRKGRRG